MAVTVLKIVVMLASAALLVPTFFLLLSLSFSAASWPGGSLWMMPWFLGLYGISGLLGTLWKPEQKSRLRLHIEMILLAMGIVAALLFMAVPVFVLMNAGVAWQLQWGLLVWLLVLAIPVLAIVLALREMLRLRSLLRTSVKQGEQPQLGIPATLLLSPLLLCGARIVGQEAVMLWYGQDLQQRAELAANQIAGSNPYCVFDAHQHRTFASLDTRQLLVNALDKRFGFKHEFRDPHFGIRTNGQNYWWSFQQGTFVPMPWIEVSYARKCPGE